MLIRGRANEIPRGIYQNRSFMREATVRRFPYTLPYINVLVCYNFVSGYVKTYRRATQNQTNNGLLRHVDVLETAQDSNLLVLQHNCGICQYVNA